MNVPKVPPAIVRTPIQKGECFRSGKDYYLATQSEQGGSVKARKFVGDGFNEDLSKKVRAGSVVPCPDVKPDKPLKRRQCFQAALDNNIYVATKDQPNKGRRVQSVNANKIAGNQVPQKRPPAKVVPCPTFHGRNLSVQRTESLNSWRPINTKNFRQP